jgi:hypothetical protein
MVKVASAWCPASLVVQSLTVYATWPSQLIWATTTVAWCPKATPAVTGRTIASNAKIVARPKFRARILRDLSHLGGIALFLTMPGFGVDGLVGQSSYSLIVPIDYP